MNGAGDHTAPSIAYRWIKANVYSALVTAVLGFAIYALGRVLVVSDPETGTLATSLFVTVASILTALSFAIFARLTAGVLERKLANFPVRTWSLLHILIGLAVGVMVSLAEIASGEPVEQPDSDPILGTFVVVMVLGVIAGAAFGSLQALVLRRVAHNVRVWIGYSTLGGLAFGAALLAALYGPQSGSASELVSEIIGAVVTVIIAIILLPAVRRLEPREAAANAASAAPPPP